MFGDLLVVLLQEPTPIVQGTGRGGGIGDFFGQIPSEVFIRCGLIALLLVAGIAFFGSRTRGQQQSKRRMTGPAASDQGANRSEPDDPPDPPAARRSYDTGDLPDLDMLLTSAPAQHEPEAPPTRTARPGVFTVKLHSGKTTEAQEVVSILRDESDGRLIVQMGEMAYRTLLDAPEAKQRFMQVMKELADVVTKPDSHAPESQPPEPQPTVIPAVPEAVKPEATSPQSPQPPALPVSPPPRVVASEGLPGDLPSFKLDDHPVVTTKGSLGRTKFHSGPIPELNIAAAIEAYLQHKLTQSSAFAGREIHVHSAPDGGVRIQVDDTYYDAVGDVADAEVRAFLSATIQEWQDRQ